MNLASTDFELFGIEPRYALDNAALDRRWRELQAQVHPDQFVAEGAAAQRVAMQWAVRVNEAYRRLQDPVKRAAYLCELRGVPIDAENNTAMPSEFLHQQMAWREALDDAESLGAVEALAIDVREQRAATLARLEAALDQHADPHAAAQLVRGLMFVERFADDIDRRLEALEQ